MEKTSSPSSVPLITELYAAFARREASAIAAMLHPHAVITQSESLPWGGVYEGLEGFSRFFGVLLQHLDSHVTVERYLDAGECVVASGITQGTVLENGAPFHVPFVHVWEVRGGKVLRFNPYIDHPAMLAALNRKA